MEARLATRAGRAARRQRRRRDGCRARCGRVELGEERIALQIDLSVFLGEKDVEVHHAIPMRMRRRGVESRIVLESAARNSNARKPDLALIKAVARASRWWDDLVTGGVRSYGEIAKRDGMTKRYVGHLMPLAFLAPEIVASIFEGKQPVGLTTEVLTKRADVAVDWENQKAVFGFD